MSLNVYEIVCYLFIQFTCFISLTLLLFDMANWKRLKTMNMSIEQIRLSRTRVNKQNILVFWNGTYRGQKAEGNGQKQTNWFESLDQPSTPVTHKNNAINRYKTHTHTHDANVRSLWVCACYIIPLRILRDRRIHFGFLFFRVWCASVYDVWIYFPIHKHFFGSHCHCKIHTNLTVPTKRWKCRLMKSEWYFILLNVYEADKMLIAHAHKLRVDTLIAFSRHVVRMYNKMQCGFFLLLSSSQSLLLLLLLFGCYGTHFGYRLLWKIICSIRVLFHSLSNSKRFDRCFSRERESKGERALSISIHISYGLRECICMYFVCAHTLAVCRPEIHYSSFWCVLLPCTQYIYRNRIISGWVS